MTTSLTGQQVFDTVAAHLFTQGQPATTVDNRCMYRAARGDLMLSCAVGCLITDEEYSPAMDDGDALAKLKIRAGKCHDGSLHATAVHDIFTVGLLPERLHPHLNLLRALQQAHDDNFIVGTDGKYAPDRLAERLTDVAKFHNLTFERPVAA